MKFYRKGYPLGLLPGSIRFSQKNLGFLTFRSPSAASKLVLSIMALAAVLFLPLAVQAVTGPDESSDASAPQSDAAVNGVSGEENESDASNNSHIETSVDVSNQANGSGEVNGSNVEVVIDGQEVPVPPNGQIHKKKSSNSTESIVDISIQGSSSNSSHTNIQINNQHYNSEDEDDELGGRLDNHR